MGKRRYPIPAVLLARLAVDSRCTGRGIGRQLLLHALEEIAGAQPQRRFELVVVYAIDADATAFYAKHGFTRVADQDRYLFITTASLRATPSDSNVQRTYLVRTLADPDPRRVPAMTTKTERLNLRCSEDSLTLLRQAAELQGQDLTSFVMGAALERARTVLAEDRVLRLSPAAVAQIEAALDAEPQPNSQLAALVRAVRGTDASV